MGTLICSHGDRFHCSFMQGQEKMGPGTNNAAAAREYRKHIREDPVAYAEHRRKERER